MNSYYYIVEIYVRGQLKTLIEMEDLARVARFVTDTEKHRAEKFYDCRVDIHLAYVSNPQRVGLEQFTCTDTDAVTRLALGG
jgi:hypothetical protein